jgi:hypothetical protein
MLLLLIEGLVYESRLTSYNIPGQLFNTIDGNSIFITMPAETDLTNLGADFELSYGAVAVIYPIPGSYEGGVRQLSGETVNDFSDRQVITVVNHPQTGMEEFNIHVETITYTKSNSSLNSISVYPNPVTDIFNIHSTIGELIQSVLVIDIRGTQIQEIFCNNNYQESIDISDLPKGAYVLRIKTSYKIYYKRIIKQ